MPTDPDAVTLRVATAEDLPAVADLHLRAREAAYPAMPRGIHDRAEVVAWVSSWDLTERDVWLAQDAARGLLGYAMLHEAWLDDLYVDPAVAGSGVGGMLLDLATSLRPDGFCLWVFASNRRARSFYTHRGLVELEHTDGSTNEEKAPDLRMAWPGTDPAAFHRRLLREVDADLADLHARRDAVLGALADLGSDATGDPGGPR